MGVKLDLTHAQSRQFMCHIENGLKELHKVLRNRRIRTDFKAGRVRQLWGFLDANMTVLALAPFRTTASGQHVTELALTVAELNRIVADVKAERDKWDRLSKNGSISNEHLIQVMADEVLTVVDPHWATLKAALPYVVNEVSKP